MSDEKTTILSEKTLISTGSVMILLGFVFGAAQGHTMISENRLSIQRVGKERLSIDLRLFDKIGDLTDQVNALSQKVYSQDAQIKILLEERAKKH